MVVAEVVLAVAFVVVVVIVTGVVVEAWCWWRW